MGIPRLERNKDRKNLRQQPSSGQQGKMSGKGIPPMPKPQNSVFKAYRYAPDYPGLQGKDLTPGLPLIQYIKKQIKHQGQFR